MDGPFLTQACLRLAGGFAGLNTPEI